MPKEQKIEAKKLQTGSPSQVKSFETALCSVKEEVSDGFGDAACLMKLDETEGMEIHGAKLKKSNPSQESSSP